MIKLGLANTRLSAIALFSMVLVFRFTFLCLSRAALAGRVVEIKYWIEIKIKIKKYILF